MRESENIQLEKEKPSHSCGFNPLANSARKSGQSSRHHTYFNNKGTSEQNKNKVQRLSKSERLAVKVKTKEKLVNLLKRIDRELSEKISKCASEFEVRKLDCSTKGKGVIGRVPYHSCDFRLCPFCALKRGRKVLKKYFPKIESFLHANKRLTPVHLVLTQKHREGETIKETRKRLLTSFKKLSRRKFWESYFAGGLYSVEMTVGSDELNHVHLHILAFRRRFFDVSILRAEWKKITGDSVNFRLDRITDLASGCREILKYISKPSDVNKFTPKHIREFLELKGAKMIGVFGEFGRFCASFDKEKGATDNEDETILNVGDACPCGCGAVVYAERMTLEEMLREMRASEIRERPKIHPHEILYNSLARQRKDK